MHFGKYIVGNRYGRLVALERVERKPWLKGRDARWRCRCDCGRETVVSLPALQSGNTKSCGCLRRETSRINGLNSGRRRKENGKVR